jgi:hypothetical protein
VRVSGVAGWESDEVREGDGEGGRDGDEDEVGESEVVAEGKKADYQGAK